MCKWGTYREVLVKVPAHLSHTGEDRWAYKPIDYCISDIVESLQIFGIDMEASCCGHYKNDGRIDLVDGRILNITRRNNG